jgi:hypothetical protein
MLAPEFGLAQMGASKREPGTGFSDAEWSRPGQEKRRFGAMEPCLGLDGRAFSDLEPAKRQLVQERPATTREQWRTLAAVVLEIVGIREAVRMGDPRLWRQGVSELQTNPLAPLNLPLPVWDLYNSHPYAGASLRLEDGSVVAVPDWSKLYYSWHARKFAIHVEKAVQFFDGAAVVGGEAVSAPAAQTAALERLQWLARAEKPCFSVRTRQRRGFIIDGRNRFRLDPTGGLLAISLGDDAPLEVVPLADISAVVLAETEPKALVGQLERHLKTAPFRPFHLRMLHGGSFTIEQPRDVLITADRLYLRVGGKGEDPEESVVDMPLKWTDRIEVLPEPRDDPEHRK